MRAIILPLFAALLMLTGCNENSPTTDAEDERNPLVNSGQEYMEQGNYDEAIAVFKQALDDNPLMARPHLDLAQIYQQYKINYIHAIYHYDRYLELRPGTEKTDMINEQKLKVAKALAQTLIENSPEVKKVVQERNQVIQQYNQLVQQNSELKQQLATALKNQKTTATPAPGTKTTATQTIPKTAKPAASGTTSKADAQPVFTGGKHQIYHVVSGDTLTKIATKYYNDPGKWDIIFEANRDSMRSAGDLRVGQTLVIPAVGN